MPHSGWARGSFQRLYESGQAWRHGAAVEGGGPVTGYRETLISLRKGCWGNLNEILRTGNDPTGFVYCKKMP